MPSWRRSKTLYFDPANIVFALPALLLSLYATILTGSRFARCSQVEPSSGMTGEEAARTLDHCQGLSNVAT